MISGASAVLKTELHIEELAGRISILMQDGIEYIALDKEVYLEIHPLKTAMTGGDPDHQFNLSFSYRYIGKLEGYKGHEK